MATPPDDQPPVPARQRLEQALAAADSRGELRYAGLASDRSGNHVVEVAGRRRAYPIPGMLAWHAGFQAGRAQQQTGLPARRPGALDPIRSVLVNPALADQLRTQIRAAIEDADITAAELARRIGRDRHAVADALRYGRPGALSFAMAEQMMSGLGRAWRVASVPVTDTPGAAPAPVAPPAQAPAEPAGVRRMRLLALADERNLVRWAAPNSANRAARAEVYQVHAGGAEHRIRSADLLPWLVGIADALDPATAADLQPSTSGRRPSRRTS